MKRYLLFFSLLSIVAFFNGCQKELSFETVGIPSIGTLQSDITGDCLPKTVTGTYEAGVAVNATTNFIEVEVDVLQAGSYLVYTDTVNGMYFRGSGTFATTGANTVKLAGNGTPVNAGISNFVVKYGITECAIAVPVLPAGAGSPAVFTLSVTPPATTCMSAVVSGTYTQGVALTASNKVDIAVNVTTIGTYDVTATLTNGMTFKGTGALLATGSGTITLTAAGSTPTAAGTFNVPVTVGTSSCSFPVTVVGPATYTVNCGSAVVNGSYAQDVTLTSSNTVDIQVNVTTIGGYTITGSVNGMTFSNSGNFTSTGIKNITLAGSGKPTAGGTFNVPMNGATPCTFPVTVSGPATYTVNCGSANVNGFYEANVPLDAGNTVDIDVNVTSPGGYTITGSVNGMTFSHSGSFTATGVQNITLDGNGTPATAGTFNVPMNGTTPCTFAVTVDPGVPTIGTWQFTQGTTTFSGNFTDAELDNSSPPITFLAFAGAELEIDLLDISGGIQNNETYNMATFTGTSNTGGFYYEGTAPKTYDADFSMTGNTMVAKVTSHNTSTKTITGTFSGKAFDENGVLKDITNGTFTVTYP
jgi:hypothetical protein